MRRLRIKALSVRAMLYQTYHMCWACNGHNSAHCISQISQNLIGKSYSESCKMPRLTIQDRRKVAAEFQVGRKSQKQITKMGFSRKAVRKWKNVPFNGPDITFDDNHLGSRTPWLSASHHGVSRSYIINNSTWTCHFICVAAHCINKESKNVCCTRCLALKLQCSTRARNLRHDPHDNDTFKACTRTNTLDVVALVHF